MKVKEVIKTLDNNGTISVFDEQKRVYVDTSAAKDREVKEVTYHDGYGYNQKNAVIHV